MHNNHSTKLMDLPFRNMKVLIKLVKKHYRCSHCGKRAISKQIKSITPYSRKTERFKLYLLKQTKQTSANRLKFFKSRMTLLMAGEELDDNSHERLIEILKLSPALEKAWELKKKFRDLLQILDVKESIAALNCWYDNVSQSKLNLFYRAKGTIKRWEQSIINYFKTRITNGFAEGLNNKIKLIKRIGYGFPKVENLKRRVFLSLLSI